MEKEAAEEQEVWNRLEEEWGRRTGRQFVETN